MLAWGTQPTAGASADTVVQLYTCIALQMFLSTQNVTRSFMNWHLMTGTFTHFASKPHFYKLDTPMHVSSYRPLRYKLSQWTANSLQTLVLRKYEKISLSESNNFNWSQKTMSPAHISSGRPAVFNRLTPNDPYMGRTAPLTSKRCILYIYSPNTGTEYFKHAVYFPFFLFKMQFVS